MQESSTGKRVLFRTVAVVLSVAGLFAVGEAIGSARLHFRKAEQKIPAELHAVARFSDRSVETVSDPYLLFRVKPGIDEGHAYTNRFGLRNGPIEERPGADTFRVLLLGGSVAWGYSSLSNEDTISAYLEEFLTESRDRVVVLAGHKIEVLNGGVFGYVSWQEALAYSRYHRRLEPDVVIVLDGMNDIYSAIRLGKAGLPMRFDPSKKHYVRVKPTLFGSLGRWLRYRVGKLKLLRALRPRATVDFDPPPAREVSDVYRAALEHLADITSRDGTLLMPVLQPTVILPDAKLLTPFERTIVESYDRKIPGQVAYYAEVYDEYRTMFRELGSARPELLLMDATGVYASETDTSFSDDCHLTSRSRRILSRLIGDVLLERLSGTEPSRF